MREIEVKYLCRSKIGFGRATCTFSRTSGGSHVLVNQAAEHGFLADLASVEFCHSDARRVVLAVGDAAVQPVR